jgi:hypothetical protein
MRVGSAVVVAAAWGLCGTPRAQAASPAAAVPPAATAAAITWPVAKGYDLLAVLDARGEALCLYRWVAASGRLELVAARAIGFDLRLEDLNGAAPTPEQVRDRLKREGRPVPEPKEPGAAGAAAAGPITVVPLRVAEDRQVLCVLDPGRSALAVYEFDVRTRRLRLAAARSLRYDFHLQELNLEGLSPRDVKDQVEKSEAIKRSAQGAGK